MGQGKRKVGTGTVTATGSLGFDSATAPVGLGSATLSEELASATTPLAPALTGRRRVEAHIVKPTQERIRKTTLPTHLSQFAVEFCVIGEGTAAAFGTLGSGAAAGAMDAGVGTELGAGVAAGNEVGVGTRAGVGAIVGATVAEWFPGLAVSGGEEVASMDLADAPSAPPVGWLAYFFFASSRRSAVRTRATPASWLIVRTSPSTLVTLALEYLIPLVVTISVPAPTLLG